MEFWVSKRGRLAGVPLLTYICQIFTRTGLSPLFVMYDTNLCPLVASMILVCADTEPWVSVLISIEKPKGSSSLVKFPSKSELRWCGLILASASNVVTLLCGWLIVMLAICLPCIDAIGDQVSDYLQVCVFAKIPLTPRCYSFLEHCQQRWYHVYQNSEAWGEWVSAYSPTMLHKKHVTCNN